MMATMALIQTKGLEKIVGSGSARTWLLRNVDVRIDEGEFVSIMGPSGAGKSTLLHILGMHDAEWSGQYWFDGQPVHELRPQARADLGRRHIGFVFQSYHLIDDLTIYENLEVPLTYRDVKKSERQSMVCDALDRFGIVGKKDLYPPQLATIATPRIILADEPTGNLHSDRAREIMETFRRLNDAGTTIVQVTHSEENARFGSRIIRLQDGWVVQA
jgi:putative ABC transport system ATP-binding protein